MHERLPATSQSLFFWVVTAAVVAAACSGYLLGSGHLLPAVGAAGILVATLLAYRWPVAAATAFLATSNSYFIFSTTPGWSIKWTTIGGGVRLEDVFMVGMLAAALVRVATPSGRRRVGKLLTPALLLMAWLVFETVRNAGSFGLSAIGELRFFYLFLSVAFCLIVSLEREAQVRSALKGFAFVTVAIPLVLLPVVLALNGGAFGPSSRAFPANVSLGLLLGLVVLWWCRDFAGWPKGLLYAATAVGALEILLDAHRSVWLSGFILLALLLLRQTLAVKIRWAFLGLLFAVTVLVATQALGHNALSVIADRGGAALAQKDTTGLRVSMWKATEPLVERSPLIGRGLGMYWDLYLPEYGYSIDVFPHSLYVMALVNLGAVGILLGLWLWVRALRICTSVLHGAGPALEAGDPRSVLAALGVVALSSIATFGIAYALSDCAVMLAGICIAGVRLAPAYQPPAEAGDE